MRKKPAKSDADSRLPEGTGLAHHIQLDPTDVQRRFFVNACGVARFTYNWGLAEWKRQYLAGEKPTANSLAIQFNAIREAEFPWTYEVHKDASARSFANLGKAFSSFFKKKSKYPQFKCKGRCRDSFYVVNTRIEVDGKRVRLPVIGWIKMTEDLRFSRKNFKKVHPDTTFRIMSATVSREADKWFISINVVFSKPLVILHKADGVVGVDLGLTISAVLSTNEELQGPKALRNAERRLKRLHRALSRKVKGSKNRGKAKVQLARQYRKVANTRLDFTHKLTTRLCCENQAVGIEGLNVKGMMQNHKLAKAISDANFGEFRRQMVYKSVLYSTRLVIADRWFPSTRKCSRCGVVGPKLPLSQRTFLCARCGLKLDRDLNAAINLKQLCTVSYTGTVGGNVHNAWGVSSVGAPSKQRRLAKHGTSNQELARNFHVLPFSR